MTGMRIGVMLLRLLLNVGLIFTVTTAINTNVDLKCNSQNYSLQTYIIPVHYNLMLIPLITFFYGQSSVFLKILTFTRRIHLHAHELQIENHTITLTDIKTNEIRVPQGFSYCKETQILVLEFDDQISSGRYILNMNFYGILSDKTGFVMINYNGKKGFTRQAYVTMFELTEARRVFPCWDQPSVRTLFNISVVHLAQNIALSNMPIFDKNLNYARNKTRTNFMVTPDLAIHLVTIVILPGEYDYTENEYSQININNNIATIWSRDHIDDQLNTMKNVVKKVVHFIDKRVYPINYISKKIAMRFVVLPNLPTKSIGGWTIAVIREKDVTYKKGDRHGRKLQVKMTVAHEVIKQYTEGFFSPMKWSELWLYKAATLYLTYYAVDKIFPTRPILELFVVQVQHAVKYNDILYSVNVTDYKPELDPIYAPLVYKKASVILRMLIHIVTEHVFYQIFTIYYIHLHHLRVITLQDFWTVIHNVCYKMEQKHGFTLKEVINTWLSQTSQPILSVYHDGKHIQLNIIGEIENTQNNTANTSRWIIPLTFTTNKELDFKNTTPKYWMTNSTMTLSKFYLDGWVIFNIQQSSFYRVFYSSTILHEIIHYLKGADYKRIHPLNRAQLIDDVYYFVMIDQIHYREFTNLIQYLAKELNFIPWHSMMNVLQYMSPFFNLPQSQDFKNYMLNIMDKFLTYANQARESNNPEANKTTVLLVLNWSCKHGLHKCKQRANYKLIKYLEDPKTYPLIPGREAWTYCAGLMNADHKTFYQLADTLIYQNNMEMLEHLACIENEDIIIDFLTSITTDVTGIWKQLNSMQLVKLYRAIVKKHARKENILNFILKNFNRITINRITKLEKLIDLIMSVYTVCDVSKIWISLKNDLKSSWGNKMLRTVQNFMYLRKSQISNVRNTFKHYVQFARIVKTC